MVNSGVPDLQKTIKEKGTTIQEKGGNQQGFYEKGFQEKVESGFQE